MALWLMRAGRHGEYEARFLADERAYLTWGGSLQGTDLTGASNYEEVRARVFKAYPTEPPKRLGNWAGQIWGFSVAATVGDLIVLPRKASSSIAIGELIGPYTYSENGDEPYRHWRPVKWLATDIPRSAFGQDLLYSFGAFMTICQVSRNDAEARVRKLVASKSKVDPGLKVPTDGAAAAGDSAVTAAAVDLELLARDGIAKLVLARFQGHGLARLAEAILRAQGYATYRSPEGADKGVDILAAPGPLGFGEPRICVQVKSGMSPVDRVTLDQLVGVMQNFKASRGLLVAWGGFKSTVTNEVPAQFFNVRLWDQQALMDELFSHYDSLPAEFRAELPLKRIWALAPDEQDSVASSP